MKSISFIALNLVTWLCIVFTSGCAGWFFYGGSLVSKNDPYIQEYLVAYRAEGNVPENQSYYLVRTETGLAIFERGPDGGGALFENHWTDSQGDHFSAWVYAPGGGANRNGYEFLVPKDRSKSALRYVYPWGTYDIQEVDGLGRPVPFHGVEPETMLFPVQGAISE